MKARKDWRWPEWLTRYLCALWGLGAFVIAIQSFLTEHFRFVLLLFGAAMLLQGLSWAPQILLSPALPPVRSALEPTEIPRITSFLLAHGAYFLILGIVAACLLPG